MENGRKIWTGFLSVIILFLPLILWNSLAKANFLNLGKGLPSLVESIPDKEGNGQECIPEKVYTGLVLEDCNEKSLKEYRELSEERKLKTNIQELEINAAAFMTAYMDDSGNLQILAEKNSDESRSLASITKLMTAMIVRDKLDLERTVLITKEFVDEAGDLGELKEGNVFSVRELLKIMLVESSNDAAKSFTSLIPESQFLGLMNQKAREIGLSRTNFFNLTGLDLPESNFSTAREVVELARFMFLNYPDLLHFSVQNGYPVYGVAGQFHHNLMATNELLSDGFLSPKIIGGKTGETLKAKKNLVLILSAPNGRYFISVVLGADDSFGEMKKIISWNEKTFE